MPAPSNPYQPYADVHQSTSGQGDARPTAIQVIKDSNIGDGLRGRVVLVTGCTSGTGLETARALYYAGATVFAAARDMTKMEQIIQDIVSNSDTKGVPRPVALSLHLESLEGVGKAAKEFEEKSGGRLDILINNAGIMAVPYGQTVDGYETHIGTNHFGHFLLFQLLKPLLIQTAKATGKTSRVIAVSSAGHRMGRIRFDDINWSNDPSSYAKFPAYGQSKLANVYMASSITRHYASQGLTGLSVHPGIVMTELARYMSEDDIIALGGWDSFAKVMKNPAQGAATQTWAAVTPHFEDVKTGGVYLADVGESGPMDKSEPAGAPGYAPHAYDEEAEEKLWRLSCEVVGVSAED